MTQVYASAMPISYADDSDDDWEPLTRLVLEAAYEAIFVVAMQSAAQTGVDRLFLTRLGGGAFCNPSGWLNDAIARAVTRFAACDLDVALVSFGRPSPDNRALLT